MMATSESRIVTEAVWLEFHQRLRSYLRRRITNEADVEDLLQDVFTRIHANAHRLDALRNLTSWVYRITRNAVIDFYRAETVRKRKLSEEESDLDAKESADDSGSHARSELASCIEPLLTQLPARYAAPLALTELGGSTQKDAAEQISKKPILPSVDVEIVAVEQAALSRSLSPEDLRELLGLDVGYEPPERAAPDRCLGASASARTESQSGADQDRASSHHQEQT